MVFSSLFCYLYLFSFSPAFGLGVLLRWLLEVLSCRVCWGLGGWRTLIGMNGLMAGLIMGDDMTAVCFACWRMKVFCPVWFEDMRTRVTWVFY
ncbi:hypothetical protein B0T17DRAFT_7331 [Bombardia bombarda]|uniref:Uncharacterized protein n=1 Tax=Bombardia bombarda TaxID=252184 RepID=A0AA39XIU6_9PEZI|nr:hypothetical protein B0T17DRAFT_7331 [Bombardia bombarda]